MAEGDDEHREASRRDGEQRDAARAVHHHERGANLGMEPHRLIPNRERIAHKARAEPHARIQDTCAEDGDLAGADAVCHARQPPRDPVAMQVRIQRAQSDVQRGPEGDAMLCEHQLHLWRVALAPGARIQPQQPSRPRMEEPIPLFARSAICHVLPLPPRRRHSGSSRRPLSGAGGARAPSHFTPEPDAAPPP